MKRIIFAGAAAATLALSLGSVPAAYAEPTKELKPATIKRGADPKIPHIQGTTIVDGERRIRLNAGVVTMVGKAGPSAYIVVAAAPGGSNARLLRVVAGQRPKVLRAPFNALSRTLNGRGNKLAITTRQDRQATVIKVLNTTTGAIVRTGIFGRFVGQVDFEGDRMVLSNDDKTIWWNTRTGVRTLIKNRHGYLADIANDRLAYFTGDPFNGGCSVYTRLSAPGRVIWRSCKQAVYALSPDASRMVTDGIVRSGLGARELTMRTGSGRPLVTFRTAGWFDIPVWETNRALLMPTHGREWTAEIRCTVSWCNRASALTRTEFP